MCEFFIRTDNGNNDHHWPLLGTNESLMAAANSGLIRERCSATRFVNVLIWCSGAWFIELNQKTSFMTMRQNSRRRIFMSFDNFTWQKYQQIQWKFPPPKSTTPKKLFLAKFLALLHIFYCKMHRKPAVPLFSVCTCEYAGQYTVLALAKTSLTLIYLFTLPFVIWFGIHSFLTEIYIAPLQGYYSEALPIIARLKQFCHLMFS